MLAALAYAYRMPIPALRSHTRAEIGAMVWFLEQLAEASERR